jgi:polyhydroxyalkanoate synthase subunit PhaC
VTVTPIDFHADRAKVEAGGGYMNLWARALNGDDIDSLVDSAGLTPGQSVGFSFIMMNPLGNIAKYTIDLIDVLDDERRLLNFLRMERWIADRPDHPGEFVRQWFKDLYQHNKLVRNELELGGRKVDLGRITMPVLNVSADGDVIIPTACSRGMGQHFGTRDYQGTGHSRAVDRAVAEQAQLNGSEAMPLAAPVAAACFEGCFDVWGGTTRSCDSDLRSVERCRRWKT